MTTKSPGQIAFETYQLVAARDHDRPAESAFTWDDLGDHLGDHARTTWELTAEMLRRVYVGTHSCRDHIGHALLVLDKLPPSREHSLVRTKLDEAMMWLERMESVR